MCFCVCKWGYDIAIVKDFSWWLDLDVNKENTGEESDTL